MMSKCDRNVMYTFKKIRASDAPNKAVFPFQLLTLAVMTALT